MLVRRVLCIPAGPSSVSEGAAHRMFSTSIGLSASRCLLSYVVLPIIAPLLGATARVGPALGIPIGAVALVFDVKGIRRFWLADHRWRWAITAIYLAVMTMIAGLVIIDVVHLNP